MSIIMGLTLLLGAHSAAAQSAPDKRIWSQVSGLPNSIRFSDVAMVDADTAWAVGNYASDGRDYGVVYLLKRTADRWIATRDRRFDQPLHTVAARSADQILVAGETGLVAQRSAHGWALPRSLSNATLTSAQYTPDGSAWVGGWVQTPDYALQPAMYRLMNDAWVADTSVGQVGQIEGLSLTPQGGGWAVGSPSIWRSRGGAWQIDPAKLPCEPGICAGSLHAVQAIDDDRAVAVGTWAGMCAICINSHAFVMERDSSGWRLVELPPAPGSESVPQGVSTALSDVIFTDRQTGFAVGSIFSPLVGETKPLIATYQGGAWSYMDNHSLWGALRAISAVDASHMIAVGDDGLVLVYGYGAQPLDPGIYPVRPVQDPNLGGVRYFLETGHTLRGAFGRYWDEHGGLAQFGYPITEEFLEVNPDDGRTYPVQYFERARFEYHPELVGTRYEVLLGLLGHTVTAQRKQEAPFLPTLPSQVPGSRYYPETGHSMAPQFIRAWERGGGLATYGYPISEAFYEVSLTDGKTYLTQYFERNRFEYHAELANTPYEVLLGLLGSEVLKARGWR